MKENDMIHPNQSLHEVNRYKDSAFPVGMYVVTRAQIIPHGRGYMDLHWHEELQLTYVTDGTLELQVNGAGYRLEKGEGILINRNFVHITTGLTDGGKYVSFNFPDKLLGFFPGSRMEREDVLPYTSQYAFPAVVFKPEIRWQREILESLEEMRELFLNEIWREDFDGSSEGYPGALERHRAAQTQGGGSRESCPARRAKYRAAVLITGIWYQVIAHLEDRLEGASKGSVRKQERLQAMLSFIHDNYMNPIRLQEIAAAASVSEGECCRCFREMIRKSPNQYLVAYRISRGIELLGSTEKSVTEIAQEAGFNDASHFIQYFKKQTGMTPGEYRNHILGKRAQKPYVGNGNQ